jgi:hypothetical protein
MAAEEKGGSESVSRERDRFTLESLIGICRSYPLPALIHGVQNQ